MCLKGYLGGAGKGSYVGCFGGLQVGFLPLLRGSAVGSADRQKSPKSMSCPGMARESLVKAASSISIPADISLIRGPKSTQIWGV